jgi:hypothetical protein
MGTKVIDINKMDEKHLREIMSKVKTGRFGLIKNVSSCQTDRDKVKLYRTKDGEELFVDKELNTRLLDSMNANKNIDLETVCSGHDKEFPTMGFNYKGKRSIREIKDILNTIPDTDITYDSQIVRTAIPIKKEPKIKINEEEYTFCGIEDVHQDYFFIRGTRKGGKTWWGNVSDTLSKLK